MSERQKDGEYGVFVSDIARGVTDEQLKEEFSKIGDVLEAVVVKNKHSGETKGYGFVKFYHMADAQHAIETPNPPLFKDGITGKPQMVKITLADSKNTLYIGHIPKGLTEKEVRAELEEIGMCTLKSFEFDGPSKLYGYAQFKDHETTIKAIKSIQKSKYTASLTPSKRSNDDGKSPTTKVLFVRGIRSQDEGELLRKQLGPELIEKIVVPLDSQKKTPLGHAFIYCNSTSDAKIIMDHNHDFDFMGQKLIISWGLPKQRKMMDGYFAANTPLAAPPYDYHYYFPGSVPQDYYYTPQIPIVDPRRSGYTGQNMTGGPGGKFDHKKEMYHPYPMVTPTTNPYAKYDTFGYPPPQDRYGKTQGGKPQQMGLNNNSNNNSSNSNNNNNNNNDVVFCKLIPKGINI
ncbi:hypothetical protein ACTFIY_005811 [Dictyostelium cf. discoideum]